MPRRSIGGGSGPGLRVDGDRVQPEGALDQVVEFGRRIALENQLDRFAVFLN